MTVASFDALDSFGHTYWRSSRGVIMGHGVVEMIATTPKNPFRRVLPLLLHKQEPLMTTHRLITGRLLSQIFSFAVVRSTME